MSKWLNCQCSLQHWSHCGNPLIHCRKFLVQLFQSRANWLTYSNSNSFTVSSGASMTKLPTHESLGDKICLSCSSKYRYWQWHTPVVSWWRGPFFGCFSSGGCWQSLACVGITPACSIIVACLSFPCGSLLTWTAAILHWGPVLPCVVSSSLITFVKILFLNKATFIGHHLLARKGVCKKGINKNHCLLKHTLYMSCIEHFTWIMPFDKHIPMK